MLYISLKGSLRIYMKFQMSTRNKKRLSRGPTTLRASKRAISASSSASCSWLAVFTNMAGNGEIPSFFWPCWGCNLLLMVQKSQTTTVWIYIYIKPCKWDKLPTSTGAGFCPSTVANWNRTKRWETFLGFMMEVFTYVSMIVGVSDSVTGWIHLQKLRKPSDVVVTTRMALNFQEPFFRFHISFR